MRFLIFSVIVFGSLHAQALQFIKCGSAEGKTLYATFGKRLSTGETEVTYFPTEFTIFSAPKTLQDRIIYYSSKDALKIPLRVTDGSVSFEFPALGPDGQSVVTESFDLHLYSPKDLRGYVGQWLTKDADGKILQKVYSMCSVFR